MNGRPPQTAYGRGLRDGIPIALGYLAVSFSFGILGSLGGLFWWQSLLISLTNVTSAGQFAGLGIMLGSGSLLETALSQFVINLRYSLMSISLTQKLDRRFTGVKRFIAAFCMTDEIFAVASGRPVVTFRYFAGLMTLPYFGWAAGTFLGAVMGDILPAVVVTSLGIALYGMFIAIVVPEARKSRPVFLVVLFSAAVSCLFRYLPALRGVSSGFAVIITAVAASAFGALVFPKDDPEPLPEGGDAS